MFSLTEETPQGDWRLITTSNEEGLVMAYFTRYTKNNPLNTYTVLVGSLGVTYIEYIP